MQFIRHSPSYKFKEDLQHNITLSPTHRHFEKNNSRTLISTRLLLSEFIDFNLNCMHVIYVNMSIERHMLCHPSLYSKVLRFVRRHMLCNYFLSLQIQNDYCRNDKIFTCIQLGLKSMNSDKSNLVEIKVLLLFFSK